MSSHGNFTALDLYCKQFEHAKIQAKIGTKNEASCMPSEKTFYIFYAPLLQMENKHNKPSTCRALVEWLFASSKANSNASTTMFGQ